MAIAVYAGSFDPITLGHVSVLRQAASLFGHVRVLVAHNPEKTYLFVPDERVEMVREVVSAMPNVSVDCVEGLVVEYARNIAARFLVRGVRGASDAGFETELAQANRVLAPEITTILLPAEQDVAEVSSSGLKALAARGESLEGFCPPSVARHLRARLGAGMTDR